MRFLAIWGDELRGCLAIEIRDEASEMLEKAHEFENSNQLQVVRGGKCSFEVDVAEYNAFFVGVYVLHI
jgi:hypothetical protein